MADCSTIEEALHADELGLILSERQWLAIQNKARILKSMKMILKS